MDKKQEYITLDEYIEISEKIHRALIIALLEAGDGGLSIDELGEVLEKEVFPGECIECQQVKKCLSIRRAYNDKACFEQVGSDRWRLSNPTAAKAWLDGNSKRQSNQ